ncbi:binding-protein-dependent transport systems inner membrane component [Oscillochloris trichoides DG-6]|uniref:Binding-protein-dependent transport systems inner membrane component n=1 Tax=Oscillochloris trichoides DG-6 TaxID=765420 RepID=E1ICA3_9CHLR|nr:ABC transporter permease [Oscillochloris trichoides]EFO81220.1 binding-protein-dependent transport systems inner membrane component [Oscillochloris trichoides DG-6]
MTTFLIRRLIQMVLVTIVAAVISYGLLYVQPGGPIDVLLAERQNSGANRINEADIQRVMQRFELDLAVPVRFSRWLIGWPKGPIFGSVGADWVVGCATPGQVRLRYPDGRVEIVEEGCEKTVTLADLEGRKVSGGVVFGDFGESQVMLRGRPVTDLIWSRLPYTLYLMGGSTLLAILLAVPLGVYSAVKQYSRFDYIVTTIAFIGTSVPSFVFGIFFILLFSVLAQRAGLPYLPPGDAVGVRDYTIPLIGMVEAGSFLDRFLRVLMPCGVLTIISLAGWSRFVRGSMLEVLQQDYVRTARAKGVREQVVILKHALRNSLIPFVTLLAGVLVTIFSGALITEAVFNWPGIGRLFVDALSRNDYNVAMAILFINVILLLLGYLITDVLYTIVDPRIRLS